jgi:hypothetical protein
VSSKNRLPTVVYHKLYQSLVQCARATVLETISPSATTARGEINTNGIRVLNLVVIPSNATSLPVLENDVISLPVNRYLLLLEAQPKMLPNPFDNHIVSQTSCTPLVQDFWIADLLQEVAEAIVKTLALYLLNFQMSIVPGIQQSDILQQDNS